MKPLSPRELEALALVSHGLTVNEAAQRMGVAHATVKSHLARARRKLEARNTANAVYLAIRLGLLP